MRDLRAVIRLELLLLLRGRGLPIAAALVAFTGAWEAAGIREQPWGAWSTLTAGGVLVSLILVMGTGDQIVRDRTRRLEGVVLSTPVSTAAYVWGKYLAALVVLVGLAVVNLVGAVLMDRFDSWSDPPAVFGHVRFPPLGPTPYVDIWLLLMVIPVIFGAAWMLTTTTFRFGSRIAALTSVLVLWILPAFGSGWPQLLDVAEGRFNGLFDSGPSSKLAMATAIGVFQDRWGPSAGGRVVALVRAMLPPPLPPVFIWNRAFFLGATVLLLVLTTWSVGQRRRGRA